ncbi:MAG: Uma2 family endonuclease [Oscillospiraceae bacterium]|jgi:Uma2 family endonuclease|nr:Uma2 family endonuclease [Oscillospiraceae bacterium]
MDDNIPGRYTYSDYAGWDDENRYELIDGIAYMMSAPTITHQSILGELHLQFATFLKGKKCRVFFAPCDVCLFGKGDDDYTVLQPDLLVVCDESILDEKRCNGAPDLVIEIISPSTSRRDRFIKLNKYLEAGVREFWIVEPEDKGVTVHILENGKYVISAYDSEKTIAVNVLDGCNIVLPEIFE